MTSARTWWTSWGLAAVLLLAAPAWASATGPAGDEAADDGGGSAPAGDEAAGAVDAAAEPGAPVFPDPVLMRRGKTYRGVGAALSITGAVAFVAGFNITIAVIRSGNEAALDNLQFYLIPTTVLMVAGLEIGAPLWSVGGAMVRQLTRRTKGDEKLRRPVANDPRYWQGQMLGAFGTAMALTGGMGVMVGTLIMVAGIWVNERAADAATSEFLDGARPWLIAGPAIAVGAGTGLLIGGLRLRKTGLDRSQKVRDAYTTAEIFPVPTVDPVSRSAGLVLVGRF